MEVEDGDRRHQAPLALQSSHSEQYGSHGTHPGTLLPQPQPALMAPGSAPEGQAQLGFEQTLLPRDCATNRGPGTPGFTGVRGQAGF